jgi:signal transduction histidine kinase/CheY-like chemotaxis protein
MARVSGGMGDKGGRRRSDSTHTTANVRDPILALRLLELDSPEGLTHGASRSADLYDFVPIALLTLDRHGIVREMNQAAAHLLSGARPRVVGLPFAATASGANRVLVRQHLARARRSGRRSTAQTELELGGPKSGAIPVRLVSRRALGAKEAYWTAILDLTERRRLEREGQRLIEAEAAARRASAAKDLFISVLGHEISAPLTALGMAAATLDERNLLDEERRRLAALIKRNVTIQSRLVEDLLDVTRLTRGKMHLVVAPTDVHEVLEQALETFYEDIAAKPLTVEVSLQAQRHVVAGDAGRLFQIFANLIKNAIKFTPPGGRIGVRSWMRGRQLVLEVSDTGIGVDPAMLERLFAPFEQVVPGAQGGVGLGLAIAKALVDLHHGTIVAASRGLGQGTRFEVALPTIGAEVHATTEVAAAESVGAGGRLLLIEDNADIAQPLTAALTGRGYRVVAVANCRAALNVDLGEIDVIISDLELPDGSGLSLLRRLRHGNQFIEAIALSGHAGPEDVAAAHAAGFATHLRKPIDLPALFAAIAAATRRLRQSPAARFYGDLEEPGNA